MKRLIGILMLLLTTITCAGTFPNTTGIVATDIYGKTYDIDALLDAGKHIVVHQVTSW